MALEKDNSLLMQTTQIWLDITARAQKEVLDNDERVSGISSEHLALGVPLIKGRLKQNMDEILVATRELEQARIDAYIVDYYYNMTDAQRKEHDNLLSAVAEATGEKVETIRRNKAEAHPVSEETRIAHESVMYALLGGDNAQAAPLVSHLYPRANQAQGKWSMGEYLG